MPRSKSLVPLSHDHHHALKLAQMLKKDAPRLESVPESPQEKARRALEFYESDLVVHFAAEEKVLYPFVKGKDTILDGLFKEIMEEHKKIRHLVESLLQDETGLEEKLDTLGRFLEGHIRKEERELFPRIQEVFSEDELNELNGKIKAVR
ncbi:MAG: hemerythrin domain-containing protein [Bacteroidota bacterium]|nr:hemerythrin domain-containing protein [Ignavibacteria bacterium]MCU7521397.1 hemerythrin domain-containing protein [Ignavibacteria bacterium]MCU7524156.1 hemerythrin domain-containing protein [Ignavibacteria bacterium]